MPNEPVNSPPVNPQLAPPKKSFAWKTFLTGCLLGGCLPPLLLTALIAMAGATTIPLIVNQLTKNPEILKNLSSSSPSSSLTVPALLATATQCGTDAQCMQNAVKTCTPAISTIDSPQFSMAFKVLGPSTKTPGNCQISFEIASVSEPSLGVIGLAGQSMVCDVKPTALASTGDILNAPDSDLNCDGPLWGLLKIVRAGQGAK